MFNNFFLISLKRHYKIILLVLLVSSFIIVFLLLSLSFVFFHLRDSKNLSDKKVERIRSFVSHKYVYPAYRYLVAPLIVSLTNGESDVVDKLIPGEPFIISDNNEGLVGLSHYGIIGEFVDIQYSSYSRRIFIYLKNGKGDIFGIVTDGSDLEKLRVGGSEGGVYSTEKANNGDGSLGLASGKILKITLFFNGEKEKLLDSLIQMGNYYKDYKNRKESDSFILDLSEPDIKVGYRLDSISRVE